MQELKVCIISKNEILSRFFELELMNMGCTVTVSTSAEKTDGFDAVIVDRDTVRGSIKCACPILSVSASQASEQNGVLPWPTPIKNIRSQLYALVDMGTHIYDEGADAQRGSVIYRAGERTFLLNGESIELSKKQEVILCELCRAGGSIVRRDRIMEILGATDGNISDVYICHLRKKLEGEGAKRLIFTHRGEGYSTSLVLEE